MEINFLFLHRYDKNQGMHLKFILFSVCSQHIQIIRYSKEDSQSVPTRHDSVNRVVQMIVPYPTICCFEISEKLLHSRTTTKKKLSQRTNSQQIYSCYLDDFQIKFVNFLSIWLNLYQQIFKNKCPVELEYEEFFSFQHF